MPTMGTIGLIGNLGGRVGKNKGDVTGLRKGATGPRPRKETAGFMAMGRLMVGGRVIIGATAGRLVLGAGGRTIGGCGERTTPPTLAPPARAGAAPRCANVVAGANASAEAKAIPQIVFRPISGSSMAGRSAVGFNGHPQTWRNVPFDISSFPARQQEVFRSESRAPRLR